MQNSPQRDHCLEHPLPRTRPRRPARRRSYRAGRRCGPPLAPGPRACERVGALQLQPSRRPSARRVAAASGSRGKAVIGSYTATVIAFSVPMLHRAQTPRSSTTRTGVRRLQRSRRTSGRPARLSCATARPVWMIRRGSRKGQLHRRSWC